MMRSIKILNTLGFMFLFVFMPLVILPFNVIHLLSAYAILALLTKYKSEFFRVALSRDIFIFLFLNIAAAVYALLLSSLTTADYSAAYYAVSTVIEIAPCAIFIAITLIKMNVDQRKFYDLLLAVGGLQVFWVLICIFFPNVREWIIASSGSEGLQDTYDAINIFRIFGLARGYTFSMPLFMGLCVIVSLALGKYRSTRYYYFVPFFALAILLNARIGLIGLFVTPIIILLFELRRNFIREVRGLLVLCLIIFVAVWQIEAMSQSDLDIAIWAKWVSDGVGDVLQFLETGEKVRNVDAVLGSMWFAPSGIELLIGTGENVFVREFQNSDLGYVVNLYYGGLLFSALLYLSYLILILRAAGTEVVEKVIYVSLILFLLTANAKGNVFRPNEIVNGSVMMAVFSIAIRKLGPHATQGGTSYVKKSD